MMSADRTKGPGLDWSRRQGVAMLLVLVALGIGVVLAGVVLTAREPAAQIGANATDDAAARWGAFAAANYAEAVLETAVDCVDYASTNDGGFIKSFAIDGGTATVTLTRLDGSVPVPGDRELIMISVADVNGMRATVEKRISLANPVPMSSAADARLGEFALFAGTSISFEDTSIVAVSPVAAEQDTLLPVKIGTGFAASSSLDVKSLATLKNAALFVDANGGSGLDAVLSDPRFVSGTRVPYAIPLIRDTQRPEIATLPLLSAVLGTLTGAVDQLIPSGNYLDLTVRGGATATLGTAGQTTVYKFANVTVESSGTLRYQGEVIVQVSGATIVRSNGAIEPVAADSKIRMYLGRNVTFNDCAIGLPKAIAADNNRKPGDVTTHPQADHVFLATLNTSSGGSASPTWQITGKSMVVASIHAPQASVTIDGKSALFGRVTCGQFHLEKECFLYYDPRLDCRAGFTELDGPLYERGVPIPEVTTLLATVSSAAGAQSFQDTLKSTLETHWAAEPEDHPLIKPGSGTLSAMNPELEDAGTVTVDNSGSAQARVQGKARTQTRPTRAEAYEVP